MKLINLAILVASVSAHKLHHRSHRHHPSPHTRHYVQHDADAAYEASVLADFEKEDIKNSPNPINKFDGLIHAQNGKVIDPIDGGEVKEITEL